MKKLFLTPEMEIILFQSADVVTASGSGFTQESDGSIGSPLRPFPGVQNKN